MKRFLFALLLTALPFSAFSDTILRQSTSIDVRVGPFVDVTDAVTPETGITLGAADQAELLKADGAATVDISGRTFAAVSGSSGWYDLTLSTTDTNTVGELVVVVQDASVSLPVFVRLQVVEESVYDAFFAPGANALSPDGALRMSRSAATTTLATVTTGSSSTSIVVSSLDPASSVNDQFNGRVLAFPSTTTTAALRGQAKRITDFNHSTQTFTTEAFTTGPAAGDIAIIY